MGLIDHLFRHEQCFRVFDPPAAPVFRLGNLQGIGQREQQEDSFYISGDTERKENGLLAIVSDGMGGMINGRSASELTINQFLRQFREKGEIPGRLQKAAQMASSCVYQELSGRSGATLVAVYIGNKTLHWISIGDSAIFLKRSGGLFQLNQEHTFLNKLLKKELEKPQIDREQASAHEDAPRLTSFIGMEPLKETDGNFHPFLLESGDVVLLCSDGISGVLTPPEIMEAMNLEPEEGCKLLELLIQEKHVLEQDNYTGIMISYTE